MQHRVFAFGAALAIFALLGFGMGQLKFSMALRVEPQNPSSSARALTLSAPTPYLVPARALGGWNLYSSNAITPTVLAAIRRQRPGIIRWFVEWDVYEPHHAGEANWAPYRAFFQTVAETDTVLIVQFWNQYGFPLWAIGDLRQRYPNPGTYEGFVGNLAAELQAAGAQKVIYEVFNELDLRSPSFCAVSPMTLNYTNTRLVTLFDNPKWSGGSGERYRNLYQAAPGPFASSGVLHRYPAAFPHCGSFIDSADWISPTAPFISAIDLHLYYDDIGAGAQKGTPEVYLQEVSNRLAVWDQFTAQPLPFFIGEIARTAGESIVPMTPAEAEQLRLRHELLRCAFPTRYIGMLSHHTDKPGKAAWDSETGWWGDALPCHLYLPMVTR
jgi:hypothetical protein